MTIKYIFGRVIIRHSWPKNAVCVEAFLCALLCVGLCACVRVYVCLYTCVSVCVRVCAARASAAEVCTDVFLAAPCSDGHYTRVLRTSVQVVATNRTCKDEGGVAAHQHTATTTTNDGDNNHAKCAGGLKTARWKQVFFFLVTDPVRPPAIAVSRLA